ncbi:phosphodiester glycosidase family protein [Litoribacter populi]|uniref:phosphodiester glycosidase family protein n=1 Tax=Litoribacter populi TaxID=2598460 RepID=UPI00117CA330|nr:phosphodiester glycosidase family protein [Litoribacter populi]
MKIRICLFSFLLFVLTSVSAQEFTLEWTERSDLNILLPHSVQVFEAHGKLADGSPLKATYTIIDLEDQSLQFKAVGSNTKRETTLETAQQNQALIAINGGYFSSNESVSLLISDGQLIASGPAKGTARGAFGMVNGQPEIVWPHIHPNKQEVYAFENPKISEADFSNAQRWSANQAIGGGPVLMKEGKVKNFGKEEGFGGSHLARHPRTAVGYTKNNELILMLVDGRQESSAGVTLDELAALMASVGCHEALNWDGGGSSAMIVADEVANIPSDIPGGNRNSLRKNASAFVINEKGDRKQPKSHVYDTENANYSEKGIWKDSNHSNYYGKSPSRIANAESEFNSAEYSLSEIENKKYQLASWWTVNTKTNSEKTLIVVNHTEGLDSMYVNQSDLKTSGKWNVLGEYEFDQDAKVQFFPQGEGKIIIDAIRLVEVNDLSKIPRKGDLRLAVISDLNSGLGAADYEWQVDSIIQRIPRLWRPDMVVCGGDMVAGMGVNDTAVISKMWKGFDKHIAEPLRAAKIPFAFTLGNHDGPRSYPIEHKAAREFWQNPEMETGLEFVDQTHFPNYYSFKKDKAFFISWEASSPVITSENLVWLEEQLSSEIAQNAQYRFVMGHMPLYAVAQERDSKGNVLEEPEKLRGILQKYDVHTYISGHQHAYYPGKRGELELLNAGAAGSGPRGWLDMDYAPQHTITIMDIFYEQDSIVYTTYDIKEKDADKMPVFDEKKLPPAVFGVNGHLIRRDLALNKEFEAGHETPIKLSVSNDAFVFRGNSKARTELVLEFYKGRNTEEGKLVEKISLKTDRNGDFEQTFQYDRDWHEWLSSGALFVLIDGNDKSHFFHQSKPGPTPTSFTSHQEKNVYGVRNIEALYPIEWERTGDGLGHWVSYTYQISADKNFNELLFEKDTKRVNSIKMLESDWYGLLGDAEEGEQVTLYHRVLASDGKNISPTAPSAIHLMKSNEPLDDFIEVPAPNFEYMGKIEEASGAGYGAIWDNDSKLWLADYGGKITVLDSNGEETAFSPLQSVSFAEKEISLNPVNGIGLDNDGNILIGKNRHLIKVNCKTGEGIAHWEVPEGNRAITSPRAARNGEIYAMSLFGEDGNFILKQNGETFELVRTLDLPDRILARTFEMESDGKTLYFPNPGSPYIQVFKSENKKDYEGKADITSISAGSNAIHVTQDGKLYLAVRASGVKPSTFHFRDEKQQRMWTMELPEVDGAEARGIGVSPDEKTLIFCSYDKGGGYYIYKLKE